MPRIGKNIYKRQDGRFEGRYIKGRKENGKPYYGYIYGSTYKEAENKLELAQADHAMPPALDVMTVSQWLNKWLGTAGVFISRQTRDRYASVISEYISPVLGEMKLLTIDSEFINAFISGSELPKRTRMDLVSIMKSAMKLAEIECKITGVADAILEVTWEENKERTLTEDEQERLTASSLYRGDKIDIGILLALYTGLRGGELCALQWEDLDLENGVICITKSIRRVSLPDKKAGARTKVIIGEPEFKSAVRDVPIPKFLMEFFTNQRLFHIPGDYILTGRSDKYMERRVAEYHLTKRMKGTGFEGVSFRTLRHTFEARCMEAGLDLQVVNAILGRKISPRASDALSRPSTRQKRENIERLARGRTFGDSLEVKYG